MAQTLIASLFDLWIFTLVGWYMRALATRLSDRAPLAGSRRKRGVLQILKIEQDHGIYKIYHGSVLVLDSVYFEAEQISIYSFEGSWSPPASLIQSRETFSQIFEILGQLHHAFLRWNYSCAHIDRSPSLHNVSSPRRLQG